MAAGNYRIGLKGKFLYGASGSTPSTEADNVDEVALNLSKRVAEALRRGKSWVAIKPTAREANLEWKMYDIEADAFLTAVKNSWMNDDRIALYPKDADSGEGLDADWYVVTLNRTENNDGFIEYHLTARPTDEERDPIWT